MDLPYSAFALHPVVIATIMHSFSTLLLPRATTAGVSTSFVAPFTARASVTRAARVRMAWTCSATTNGGLVNNLVREAIVKTASVERALRVVDRSYFVPGGASSPTIAYKDSPQLLVCNATISAPHMHAMALELLADRLRVGASALDVGSGSGVLCACMAYMVGKSGRVDGVEHVKQLVESATTNIAALRRDSTEFAADSAPIELTHADGRIFDDHVSEMYDAIHVGAAAVDIPPAYVRLLKKGGAMVIPVGPPGGSQSLEFLTKTDNGAVEQKTVCYVSYVPLCDREQQDG